jgi:ATP-dependent Clp protease protease subunit
VIRVRADLEAALAADTGRDVVTLRHDTDRDLILPAQAAVDYGLADRVLTAQVPVGATAVGVGP